MHAAGLLVRGVTYFNELFADDETVTTEDRIKSIFVGSVAYRRLNLANEAYTLLVAQREVKDVNDELVDKLNRAMSDERKNWKRLDLLEGAAKALGKPLLHRFLGGIATSFSMFR